MKMKLEADLKKLQEMTQQAKPSDPLKKRIQLQRVRMTRQRERLKDLKKKIVEQHKKIGERLENRIQRDKTAIDKQKVRIEAQKVTRDYNLATSLKSYIDPRIYHEWGKQVNYDWKHYYSKTLQRKFSWVEHES
jgi:DNA topoisomerase-1